MGGVDSGTRRRLRAASQERHAVSRRFSRRRRARLAEDLKRYPPRPYPRSFSCPILRDRSVPAFMASWTVSRLAPRRSSAGPVRASGFLPALHKGLPASSRPSMPHRATEAPFIRRLSTEGTRPPRTAPPVPPRRTARSTRTRPSLRRSRSRRPVRTPPPESLRRHAPLVSSAARGVTLAVTTSPRPRPSPPDPTPTRPGPTSPDPIQPDPMIQPPSSSSARAPTVATGACPELLP